MNNKVRLDTGWCTRYHVCRHRLQSSVSGQEAVRTGRDVCQHAR